MRCPYCTFENLEGTDLCGRCQADLTSMKLLDEGKSDIERDLLRRPIGSLARNDYIEVPPNLAIREVIERLNQRGLHCAIVVETGAVVGIFTERDVLTKLAHRFDSDADKPVSEFMTAQPETLNFDAPVAFGLNRMMVGDYRHLPILQENSLAGVVSVRDIIGYILSRQDEKIPAKS